MDANHKPSCFCNLCGDVFENSASVKSVTVRKGRATICDDCLSRCVSLAFRLGMKKVGHDRVIFPGGK